MQPYIFPYIGYFQLIYGVDKFVIYNDVNFINRGWINRNNILVGGKASLFSIPLKKASQNKLISEVEVSTEQKWKAKLLKTLTLAYKKAPCFEATYALVEEILEGDYVSISDLATSSIRKIMNYLSIDTQLVAHSAVYNNSTLKGQDRILDICLQEQAKTYINPIGGMEIYDNALFEKNEIDLFFIKTMEHKYTQYKNAFVPYLSIIDVLMFNEKEAIWDLLPKYKLIKNG